MNTVDSGSPSAPAVAPQPPVWSLRARLIALAVLVALIGASAAVVAAVFSGTGLARLDRPTLDAMVALRSPGSAAVVTAFTNLGQTVAMVIIGLSLTSWLYWRYRRGSIWVLMLVAPIISVSLTELSKLAFARPRPPYASAVPPYETSFSLPSGHTLNSTVVAGTLAYLTVWLTRRVWVRVVAIIAAITWAVLIGLSRVFLGHHWLTDVTAGWLMGLSWLTMLILGHQIWLARRAAVGSI
jgi:membrane-associated phospholipid phosphatase